MNSIGLNNTIITKTLSSAIFAILTALFCLYSQNVKANTTIELVFITSEHCLFCKAWERQVGYLYDQTPYGKAAPLRRIDISEIQIAMPNLSPKVIGTPTFIIISSGQEIGRIRGYTDPDMFYWQLSEYISAHQ